MTDNDFFGKTVRTVFLRQSVAELEELARGDGHLVMQYDPVIQEEMQKQLPVRMECALHFSKSMIAAALDYVRNTILDWAAELERQGVIGEGMSFDADDKREARSVTNNIYGSNVGVLGSVAGNADSKEFYSAGRDISITKVNELVKQIREVIPALPDNIQQSILPSLKLLEEPDQPPGKIRATLSSIKAVLEGAAGNLAASGILAAIASL